MYPQSMFLANKKSIIFFTLLLKKSLYIDGQVFVMPQRQAAAPWINMLEVSALVVL